MNPVPCLLNRTYAFKLDERRDPSSRVNAPWRQKTIPEDLCWYAEIVSRPHLVGTESRADPLRSVTSPA